MHSPDNLDLPWFSENAFLIFEQLFWVFLTSWILGWVPRDAQEAQWTGIHGFWWDVVIFNRISYFVISIINCLLSMLLKNWVHWATRASLCVPSGPHHFPDLQSTRNSFGQNVRRTASPLPDILNSRRTFYCKICSEYQSFRWTFWSPWFTLARQNVRRGQIPSLDIFQNSPDMSGESGEFRVLCWFDWLGNWQTKFGRPIL